MQLPSILAGLSDRSPAELLSLAAIISAVVIIVRILWVFPGTYVPRALSKAIRESEPYPPPKNAAIVAWAGMRGVVSLAAALALPLTLADGVTPFPERDLLIFLTFAVILATLVGQGLTLPFFIRALGVVADGDDHEEAHARMAAAEAAVLRIEELAEEWPGHLELIDALRAQYGHRASHIEMHHGDVTLDDQEQELLEHRQIRGAVIDAEREALNQMRERGAVSDDVFRRVERDLDLEELRMEA